MRSHAAPVAVVLALLLVTTSATVALQDAPASDEPRVEIDVYLATDGDARWTIATRFALNSTNETRAFEQLAAEYEAGAADVGFSASEFREVAGDVAERTDRDMAVTRVNRTAYVDGSGDNRTGVIALEFTWTEFARVDGDRVVVDDAFSGGWLARLSESQTLRLHGPENYGVDTAFPSATFEGGTATWNGPREFDTGQPRVVFLEGAIDDPTTTPGPNVLGDGVQMALVMVTALLAGGLVVFWWTQRRGDDDDDGGGAAAADAEPEADEEPSASAGDAGASEPASVGAGGDGAAGAVAVEDAVDDGVDPELLSDEERVERLLRRNGGRMKQGSVVSETGWSNAKVSQLLSSMSDEGRVEKLRIGRENLITLVDGDDGDDPG